MNPVRQAETILPSEWPGKPQTETALCSVGKPVLKRKGEREREMKGLYPELHP